jgi:hypothetical protein
LRKIVIILFLSILAGGCSLSRKAGYVPSAGSLSLESENYLENVIRQNISSKGFFIKKADVELNDQSGKQKFLASIKFEFPDKYLISLKSKTGIEGARIYITKDSLIVNDRVNKRMYFGTKGYLRSKFGLNQSLLPLIFGDLITENNRQDLKPKCLGGKIQFVCVLGGVTLNYIIDCKRYKSSLVTLKSNYLQQNVIIRNEGYLKTGSIILPDNVQIEDLNTNTTIRIKFLKLEYPWNGKLKFIPGKGYELIELL